MSESGEWYFAIGNDRFGPEPISSVQQRIVSAELSASSLVWKESMPDWIPVGNVPELASFLSITQPEATSAPMPGAMAPTVASPLGYYAAGPASVQYAGFWTRFVAMLIDSLIIFVPNCIIGSILSGVFTIFGVNAVPTTMSAGNQGLPAASVAISWTVGIVIRWLYFAFFESSGAQATLGKMAVGIVVTDTEGKRISFAKATGRFFGKFLSAIILMVGFIMAAFTDRKQALHDLLAGTLVVIGKRKGGEVV